MNATTGNALTVRTGYSPASLEALAKRAVDASSALLLPVTSPSDFPAVFGRHQYAGPGILMAWRGLEGELITTQYRPDVPQPDANDRPMKYVFPAGGRAAFGWVVPPVDDKQPVLIVEGMLKALAVAGVLAGSHAVAAVPGCHVGAADCGWAAGRDVTVFLDADLAANRDVWNGGKALEALLKKGHMLAGGAASVRFATVPALPGDPKAGVDDILAKLSEADRRKALAAWIQGAGRLPEQPAPADARIVPSPDYPHDVAEALMADYVNDNGDVLLVNRDGVFHAFDGTCWIELSAEQIHDEIHTKLASAYYRKRTKDGEQKTLPWNPKIASVKEVVRALQALTNVSRVMGDDVVDNVWLPAPEGMAQHALHGQQVIAFRNGLIAVNSKMRAVHPHSPQWFSQTCLPFDYDPYAAAPTEFIRWTRSVWSSADVSDCVDLLQEFFGYVLSGRTDLHVFLNLYGPRRSGKSLAIRILSQLIGKSNVAALNLGDLGKNFGMANLIGKAFAADGDVRMGSMHGKSDVLSMLLKITGEDSVQIDRKYRKAWIGQLPTRFILASNDPLDFSDESGALSARTLLLPTVISFADREDRGLFDRIVPELSGIANWALAGLARLEASGGRFTRPASARAMAETFHRASAPLSAFLDDWTDTGDREAFVPKSALYDCYKQWCTANGQDHVMTQVAFAKGLYATHRGIEECKPRMDGKQVRAFRGVKITATLVPGSGYTDPEPPAEPVADPIPASGVVEPELTVDTPCKPVSGSVTVVQVEPVSLAQVSENARQKVAEPVYAGPVVADDDPWADLL